MIAHLLGLATLTSICLSAPVLLGLMVRAQSRFPHIYTQKLPVPKFASLSLSSGTDYVGLI